jgi:hypothetical protein
MLTRHTIKTVGLQPRKVVSFLQPFKDDPSLKTPGTYSILCECGKLYTGQTDIPLRPESRVPLEHQAVSSR